MATPIFVVSGSLVAPCLRLVTKQTKHSFVMLFVSDQALICYFVCVRTYYPRLQVAAALTLLHDHDILPYTGQVGVSNVLAFDIANSTRLGDRANSLSGESVCLEVLILRSVAPGKFVQVLTPAEAFAGTGYRSRLMARGIDFEVLFRGPFRFPKR